MPTPLRSAGGRKAGRHFLSFEAAKHFMDTLGVRLQTLKQFRTWSASGERPANIPSRPDRIYADQGWSGFPDFLGYDPSKYDPVRRDVDGIGVRPTTILRESLIQRGAAQRLFVENLRQSMPDMDVARLSSRWSSVLLLRRKGMPTEKQQDQWIAVQFKFASANSSKNKGFVRNFVFHDVRARDDIPVIFTTDESSEMAFWNSEEIFAIKGQRYYSCTRIALRPFETAVLKNALEAWWASNKRATAQEWTRILGYCGCTKQEQHDMATFQVANLLYAPLDLSVEKIFPLDACTHGNVLLSGTACMQKIARSRPASYGVGYFVDVNKRWHCGVVRRGDGISGAVERYICIILDSESFGRVRGVFIFPRSVVFRGDKGSSQPSRRARLYMYPPFVSPGMARTRALQREQSRFYVDLETLTKDEQMCKTKQLLGF